MKIGCSKSSGRLPTRPWTIALISSCVSVVDDIYNTATALTLSAPDIEGQNLGPIIYTRYLSKSQPFSSSSSYRVYFHVLIRLFSQNISTVYTSKDGYSVSLFKYIGNDHHRNGSSRDRSRDELIWYIPLQSPSRERSRDGVQGARSKVMPVEIWCY